MSSTVDRKPSSGAAPEAGDRSDVFLCYSRRDREFVERLHAALHAGGKEVYVDWEDIPDWSEDYQTELFRGIETTDTFIVVLSPDLLASPHCKLELEHAVDQGKRLRPLLIRDVDDAAVPDALKRPQWIDFRDDGEFDAAAARLQEALDVDADWVRMHTRIGLRAGDWDRRERDASFLLRGSDLRDAEGWLAEQAGKEPAPTELQSRYVLASRRATDSTPAALVRRGADRAGRRDRARDLRARPAQPGDRRTGQGPLRGTRVCRERPARGRSRRAAAPRLAGLRDEPRPFRRKDSMISALEAARSSGAEAILRRPSGSFLSVAFSPDGRTLATGGRDDSMRLWDLRTHRELARPVTGDPWVYNFALSRDGRMLASEEGGTVRLWDLRTRREIGELRGHTDSISGIAFSPDGRTLAGASGDKTVRLWNVRTRREIRRRCAATPTSS